MRPEDPTLPAAEFAPTPVSASPHRQSWRRCDRGASARSPGADMEPAISRQCALAKSWSCPLCPVRARLSSVGRSRCKVGALSTLGTKAQNARDAGAVKSALRSCGDPEQYGLSHRAQYRPAVRQSCNVEYAVSELELPWLFASPLLGMCTPLGRLDVACSRCFRRLRTSRRLWNLPANATRTAQQWRNLTLSL